MTTAVDEREIIGPHTFDIHVMPISEALSEVLTEMLMKIESVCLVEKMPQQIRGHDVFRLTMRKAYESVVPQAMTRTKSIVIAFQAFVLSSG